MDDVQEVRSGAAILVVRSGGHGVAGARWIFAEDLSAGAESAAMLRAAQWRSGRIGWGFRQRGSGGICRAGWLGLACTVGARRGDHGHVRARVVGAGVRRRLREVGG